MAQRLGDPHWKPLIRCKSGKTNGTLAAGTSFANTNVRYEIHNVSGCSSVSARIKTATAGGTLDLFFVGPDVDIDSIIANDTAYASIGGTIYTTGNATQGTVTAGTECLVTATCHGEDFVIVKFTGGGSGTITYCDVARVSVGIGS